MQCNEPKTKDSPSADVGLSNSAAGKRISETGSDQHFYLRCFKFLSWVRNSRNC